MSADYSNSQRWEVFEVLIVDNHPLIREYLSSLLSKEGYTVLIAEDGLAAIDVLNKSKPKVIFVDLIMPNIDGQTFCRIVRRMPEHKDCFLAVLSATAGLSSSPGFCFGPTLLAWLRRLIHGPRWGFR